MGRAVMTRLLRRGALLAVLGLALATPPLATAESACSQRVRLDWAADGKVDRTYPVTCYEEALENLPIDLSLYSSAEDDIRRALQSVVAAGGNGGSGGGTQTTANAPPVAAAEDGDSVPVALIVLGGVALLLIAVGAVGVARRRSGGSSPGTS
jgi:hypothetical protein